MKIKFGLFGSNGHQIDRKLAAHPGACLVAHAGFENPNAITAISPGARPLTTVEELLTDPGIDAISLCSPRRDCQAAHAAAALRAGKHVYAEKPCAFSEAELDELLRIASQNQRVFREMSGTMFDPAFWRLREVVLAGEIGEPVQVLAQKSYPDHPGRPMDEGIDGGLTLQVGIHAIRYLVHGSGLRPVQVECVESRVGCTDRGELRRAANLSLVFENGALGSAVVNYANPTGLGSWGNEMVRVWGTKGMVEVTESGKQSRLIVGAEDRGSLELGSGFDDLQVFLDQIAGVAPPISPEEEFLATRMLLRGKAVSRSI